MLIPNWKKAYKYLTVQLSALLVIASTAYDYLPDIKEAVPDGWVKWVGLAILVARLLHQPSVSGKNEGRDG